jgi:predicted Zn-dependent protease
MASSEKQLMNKKTYRDFLMPPRMSWKPFVILLLALLQVLHPALAAQAQLSIEEEKKMGQKFLVEALRHLQMIEDPEVAAYENKVGQKLVNHLDVHIFPYHFYVVDSNVLNAFAAPAGYVFINRGLIEIMEDEGELAAILGHEIAHVQSRHISQRMARAKKLNWATIGGMLAGIFLGGAAGAAVMTGGMAASNSMQLKYSRLDEEEADRKGLRYLEASGYRGEDFVSIMKKMGQDSWQSGGRIPSYLSTHPGVPERVNYLATTLETRRKSSPTAKRRIGDRESFQIMQAKLIGGYHDPPAEAEAILRDWLEQPNKKVMAYYGLGLVYRRQGKMDDAVDYFRSAISRRPDLSSFLIELGATYFQMGNLDSAVAVVQSALILQPDQPTALYLLGRCQLEQGNPTEALKNLIRAARLNNRLDSIHYHLGMAYGRSNQLGEAHYHFGLYYLRRGSLRNADFHLQEALRRTDDPARREAIRRRLAMINKEVAEAVKKEQKEDETRRR